MTTRAIVALALLAACSDGKSKSSSSDKGTESPASAAPPSVESTTVAEKVDYPLGLALDDTHLYWGDGPKLMRAPKQGGDAEVVCSVEAIRIGSIAVDGDTLYAGALGGGLFRWSKGDGAPVRIGTSGNPRSLVVDDTRVYWYDGGVRTVAKDAGGGATPPPSWTAGNAAELVADDTHLYWHDGNTIRRRPKAGGEVEAIASTGHLDVEIAVDDTHLYWGDDASDLVLRWPKAGGPIEYVADDWGYGNLVVDGDWLYVVDIETSVYRIHKQDGRKARLAYSTASTFNKNGIAVAVDAEQLYVAVDAMRWDTPTGDKVPGAIPLGMVVRMPKTVEGLTYQPRATAHRLGTVYFDAGSTDAQDIGNATYWVRGADAALEEAVRSGRLPIRVVAGGDPAQARQRADAVVAALRAELGDAAKLEASIGGVSANVVMEVEVDAFANVWAIAPPPTRTPE